MKLRFRGQTLRIRLDQREVSDLGDGGTVEQRTAFSESSEFVCRVQLSADVRNITATFASGRVTVMLPADEARKWARTEQVGMEAHQVVGSGRSLHILIEKDFECLHGRPEEDADTFPNPRRSASS